MVKHAPKPQNKLPKTYTIKGNKGVEPKIPKMVGKRILIIVESPKKIKKIASYLPKDNSYKILPSVGHVVELAKLYAFNLGLDFLHDYKPKFVISKDKMDILRAIITAANESDKILIATDPDREGEFIGYSIAERLRGVEVPIKRIDIHEITKKGISESLENERDIDMGLVEAAISRRVLDRVVGFLVSPLVIKRLGDGLSAGRVQSVALRLLVEKELEIEAFVPEEYWNIGANLIEPKSKQSFVAKYVGNKVLNQADAEEIKKELSESSYSVSKIESKEVKKTPPIPITTSRLQMLASGRYNFGGQRTMKAAQRLYENGLITYIRTDSVRQSEEAISDIRNWIKDNKPDSLPKKENVYKNKGTIQDAHEAIRPTHISTEPTSKTISDEDKLYRLIWEITVSSQMTPAIYDVTNVYITTDKGKELKVIGKILKESGWLSVSKYSEIEREDESDITLPKMNVGDSLLLESGASIAQKFTQPPKRYSEGTLIKELEKRGIGRPSTYADITNKIITRQYVKKEGKGLIATAVGKKLVLFLKEYFSFMEYNFTSNLELKLDEMVNGKLTYVEMMNEFYPPFKKNIEDIYLNTEEEKNRHVCKNCGALMVMKFIPTGIFLGCSNYPFCKNTVPCDLVNGEVVLSVDKLRPAPDHERCPRCNGKMVIRTSKYGELYCCADSEVCRGWKRIPTGKICPKCGKPLFRMILRGEPFNGPVLTCSGYPRCRYFERLIEEDFEEKRKEIRELYESLRKPLGRGHKDFVIDEDEQ